MLIAHAKGHPVLIKTSKGGRFIAFKSLSDGQVFLRHKQVHCALDTLDEILRLNPSAFSRDCSALLLPTREAIEQFITNPKTFPTDEYLVTLKTA
jgi:hypothetical protein